MSIFSTVKQRWTAYNPNKKWWGDSIDVRFHLISQLQLLKNQRILDIGCSIGILTLQFDPSNEAYGFDINTEYIERAQKLNPNGHFVCHSMFELFPYEDDYFDTVIMSHACPGYNFPASEQQQQQVFEEMHRVLKPGGTLYLTTSNKNYRLDRHHYIPGEIFHEEVRQDLQMFRDVEIYGWNPLPSFVFFLPQNIFAKIPPKYWKFLYVPSPILAKIPHMDTFLRWLMTKAWLRKYSKTLYVHGKK